RLARQRQPLVIPLARRCQHHHHHHHRCSGNRNRVGVNVARGGRWGRGVGAGSRGVGFGDHQTCCRRRNPHGVGAGHHLDLHHPRLRRNPHHLPPRGPTSRQPHDPDAEHHRIDCEAENGEGRVAGGVVSAGCVLRGESQGGGDGRERVFFGA
ncbi:hypothetical protein HDU96_005473, partial [Phlyctochytrium bullatum]